MERKNKNRGYQPLRVWQDAATLYVEKVCLATLREADQLSEDDFEILDHQAFKLENGLLSPDRISGTKPGFRYCILDEESAGDGYFRAGRRLPCQTIAAKRVRRLWHSPGRPNLAF
jgi:hypothetical protein